MLKVEVEHHWELLLATLNRECRDRFALFGDVLNDGNASSCYFCNRINSGRSVFPQRSRNPLVRKLVLLHTTPYLRTEHGNILADAH